MRTFRVGDSIKLAAVVTWFGKIVTGAVVTVKVVDVASGDVVLAEVAMPESAEPGLYLYDWSAPSFPRELVAIYRARNYSEVEDIVVVGSDAGSSASGLVASVADDAVRVEVSDPDMVSASQAGDVVSGQVPDEGLSSDTLETNIEADTEEC